MTANLCLTQESGADQLLSDNPFALLVGMLLDQQIPMEVAFGGPKKIADRIGGFDAATIADYDPDDFAALCSQTPAIHRFPGSMSKRVQALAQVIVDEYGGDATALWSDGADGADVLRRLKALPGFGEQKAKIFLALLGKQYGRDAVGVACGGRRLRQGGQSHVGRDVKDAGSLQKVRSYKKEMKAAAKAAKA